ncbi:MAG: polysaccharide deacetylase, partial [Lachnospiraceae bacterium]|nr:polysaccharide deacetylase [Lachnospiraceae bacterium]
AQQDELEQQEALIEEGHRLSAGYDYDAAIELIQSYDGYEDIPEMTDAIETYETAKAAAVKYEDVTEITHIFYHSLIVDTSLAFDGDSEENGYNEVMATVDEFKAILQEMYDRGYVLVSIHDIGHIEIQEDGSEKMVPGEIYLPEGKKPYVLSQDDVSYYHYMEDDGFATKIVIGEDGTPTCEYVEEDGTVVYGDYDMIPLVDSFVEEHPDASYRGARGIITLTGYNGILGYRTDPSYQGNDDDLSSWKQEWLDAHPDFDYEQECEEASAVAEALKADDWEFASHSYGHRYYGQISESDFIWDSNYWEETVEPLIGETDIMIFAFGDDIGDWQPYTSDNSRYQHLKELGFDYFCNVDSAQYWVQFGDDYLRQGRRNIDGNRMWEALSGGKDRLSDLFDVKEVFDPARPTPVV